MYSFCLYVRLVYYVRHQIRLNKQNCANNFTKMKFTKAFLFAKGQLNVLPQGFIKVELWNGFYLAYFTDSGIKFIISKGIIIAFILSTPSLMVSLALGSSCVKRALYLGQAWSWGGRSTWGVNFHFQHIILAVCKLFTAYRNMIGAGLTLTPLEGVFSLSTRTPHQFMCQTVLVFMLSLEEKFLFYSFLLPVLVFYFFKKLFKVSGHPAFEPIEIFSHISLLVTFFLVGTFSYKAQSVRVWQTTILLLVYHGTSC